MIIYKSTNKVNSKCYIGQTIKTLSVRQSQHLYGSNNNKSNSYFHKSINKYGWDNFSWEVLCECRSKEELDKMEKSFIKQYHSHVSDNGYNLTWGGCGVIGYKHTSATKDILRELIKNNNPIHKKSVKNKHNYIMSELVKSDDWISKHKLGCMSGRYSYIIINQCGYICLTKGICEFSLLNNLSQPKLSEVSNGNRRSTSNYKIYHMDRYRRIRGYINYITNFCDNNKIFMATSPYGDVFYSDNPTTFSINHNIKRGGIYECLKGRQKSHSQWVFNKCDIIDYVINTERYIKSIIGDYIWDNLST